MHFLIDTSTAANTEQEEPTPDPPAAFVIPWVLVVACFGIGLGVWFFNR
jgi:hypothetical protein